MAYENNDKQPTPVTGVLGTTFASVPKLSYFGFGFTSEDATALMAKMQ